MWWKRAKNGRKLVKLGENPNIPYPECERPLIAYMGHWHHRIHLHCVGDVCAGGGGGFEGQNVMGLRLRLIRAERGSALRASYAPVL